jgi:hypothetical protein
MNYNKFNFTDSRVTITHVKNIYSRTASGKSWKKAPDETSCETVNAAFYTNYITSIPFFNNFGTCRAQHSYTPAGYLPTVITSISPDKNIKHVDSFIFEYK